MVKHTLRKKKRGGGCTGSSCRAGAPPAHKMTFLEKQELYPGLWEKDWYDIIGSDTRLTPREATEMIENFVKFKYDDYMVIDDPIMLEYLKTFSSVPRRKPKRTRRFNNLFAGKLVRQTG